MPDLNPLRILAELLEGAGALPDIVPDRLAPSTVYDLQYRLAVNACVFMMHAKVDLLETQTIQTAKLKLLQFTAIRPWLLPVIQEWSASQHKTERWLFTAQHLRRGFLGDLTHDLVIDLLTARRVLVRSSSRIVAGENIHVLAGLYNSVLSLDLFRGERAVLEQAKEIRITNRMLEGL